jgi:glyoxylase-like metal-dependent hydrolase (beta-lactamase superfamily II)/ADP-ribose pyrophosphatase YjhB (NUDIX family)
MSELPDHVSPAKVPDPKPSALGIVLRRSGDGWELLFGRRAATSRFMPGYLAFPGGRFEKSDGIESDPLAWARCVAREMLEESGLDLPVEAWIPAGERTTPPFFPVRFRTAFFVAELPAERSLPATPPQPEEIATLEFRSAPEMLDAWARGEVLVPPPVLPILREAALRPPASAGEFAARVGALNAEEQALPRIEFVPDVWVWPTPTATLPPATHTNVWMPGGARFVVIDPGCSDAGEVERIVRVVRRRESSGPRAVEIVLTHHHRDHVDGAAALARELGLPVAAHAATLDRVGGRLEGLATRPIADGDLLDLGGQTWTALHTPGHAPGHLAFHEPTRRWLIAGDLVSGLSTILVGLADGDMGLFMDSLRRVAALGARVVLPSHGAPLPGKALAAALIHRETREIRVMAAIAGETPRGLAEIAGEAYADTPEAPAPLRESQTRAHLEKLEREGRATRGVSGWSAVR